MEDRNARDFRSVTFIRKQDLRANGPRVVTVKDVEEADGLPGRNGKPAKKELVLLFTDQTKLSLRTQANLDTMMDLHGEMTSGWVGKRVTLVFDPSVQNPMGGEAGGIRLRRPDTLDEAAEAFVSDLDEPIQGQAEHAPPKKQKPRAGRSKPDTAGVDDDAGR